MILTIWNCFIILFKDFKLGIILCYNTDSEEVLSKPWGDVVKKYVLKSRHMPSGRCLVPVVGDIHQNKDFLEQENAIPMYKS